MNWFRKIFPPKNWSILNASVQGPSHIKNQIPNQDFSIVDYIDGCLLAMVCDGLGSHKYSHIGAKNLCHVFVENFKRWHRQTQPRMKDFLQVLQKKWICSSVKNYGVSNCGCTCQLAILNKKGQGWLAQLGDGITLTYHNNKTQAFTEEKRGSANETTALGELSIMQYWRLHKIDISKSGDCLFIMTDGISEDILDNKHNQFVQNFEPIFLLPKFRAQKKLIEDLTHWPTPHHLDDKTIVAIQRR